MSVLCVKEGFPSDSLRCGSVTCDSVSVNINSLHVLRIKYELLELVAALAGWEISNQHGQHQISSQLKINS